MESKLGLGTIKNAEDLNGIDYHETITELFNAAISYHLKNDLRLQLAAEFNAERKELKNFSKNPSGDFDLSETTEKLAKASCVLDPNNKVYWRAWTDELAPLSEEDRQQCIADISIFTADLPRNELNQEFYTDYIGKNDIDKELKKRDGTKKAVAKKVTFHVDRSKFIVPLQENVDAYCYNLVQKGKMDTDRKSRQIVGLNLAYTVKQQAEELNPLQMGTYLLYAAGFADNDKPCAAKATSYIVSNIADETIKGEDAEALIHTAEILLKTAPPTTEFAKEAGFMLVNLKKTMPLPKTKSPILPGAAKPG